MNIDQAYKLINASDVELTRRGATWHGEVVGIVNEPVLILQEADGHRVTIALSETELKEAVDATR